MRTILLLSFWAGLAFGQQFSDIRLVNGRRVDLGPVRAWLAKPAGERPMKHWKILQVVEIRKQVGTWDECAVTFEDGAQADVLLNHCDSIVRTPILNLSNIDARLGQVDEQRKELQAESSGPATRNALAARRSARGRAAQRIKLLAMFTGQKYEGLQVWDCGAKSQ
ncbi:MAG TPA: hypothetical protein VG028_13400 [Terriglobia bacterium]|nr:hypothetical protein [Terriglobia bacterium]